MPPPTSKKTLDSKCKMWVESDWVRLRSCWTCLTYASCKHAVLEGSGLDFGSLWALISEPSWNQVGNLGSQNELFRNESLYRDAILQHFVWAGFRLEFGGSCFGLDNANENLHWKDFVFVFTTNNHIIMGAHRSATAWQAHGCSMWHFNYNANTRC